MATITTETRKRGVFGWIIAVLFWGWNAVMALALVAGLNNAASSHDTSSAFAAGATIGAGLLLVFWLLGSLVLGLMMVFTRGRRVSITKEV